MTTDKGTAKSFNRTDMKKCSKILKCLFEKPINKLHNISFLCFKNVTRLALTSLHFHIFLSIRPGKSPKKPAAALQCSQSIFKVCFVWKEMYLNFYKLFSSSYRCMVMTIFYNVLSGVPTIFWHKHYNYYSLAILRCLALPKRCSKRNFIFAKEMDLAAAIHYTWWVSFLQISL